jgi:uncharacterized membrane protein
MVEALKRATELLALGIEVVATLIVLIAVLQTLWLTLRRRLIKSDSLIARREVWRNFGVWLVLGLEFQLAADIVRTAIEPSWQQIAQLGAIAAIRTFLNYFLIADLGRNAPTEPLTRTVASSPERSFPRAADRA